MQYHSVACITMQYHAIPHSTMTYRAVPCNTMHYHAIPCNTVQYCAIPCQTMQYNAGPCNIMQYHGIPWNTMQYHASWITAVGAYHCPVGSSMVIFQIWNFYIFHYTLICRFADVHGSCRAQKWNINNYRGCCVQRIFSKIDLEAKQSGQFCICLWALSGPELGYIQIYGMLCTKYITKKRISRPNRSVCFYEDRNILPKCVYLHAPSSGPTLQ